MVLLPEQLVSNEDKFKLQEGEKIPKWFKDNRRYFSYRAAITIEEKELMHRLYEAADEILNGDDYARMINPLKAKKPEYQGMPAELRNYSVVKPLVERMLGERRRRPNKFEVLPVGTDAENEINEKVEVEYKARMTEKILSLLQAKGIDTGTVFIGNLGTTIGFLKVLPIIDCLFVSIVLYLILL